MKKCLIPLLSFFLTFISFNLLSQTGTISGMIIDKSMNGETMPGVLIMLDTTGKSVRVSDFDGKYEFTNVPVGTYSITFKMLTYATVIVSGVEVIDGKTQVVNVSMDRAAITKNEVVFYTVRTTNSEVSVIREVENSNQVAVGIGGAQIAKGSDPTAAEAVKRVPGVTIVDNRFIMVRGLNERYNNVWLNDAGAPSAEVDKRAFSFDMVPSGVLDRIMIYKTPSADLPADFAGGMVKIYTKGFPDAAKLNVTLQGSYRTATTFRPFSNVAGSSTDIWGMDDGSRDIPHEIDAYISKSNYDETNLFHNDWVLNTRNASPDGRFSMMYAAPISFGDSCGWTAGNTFGLSYGHSFTTYDIRRQDWDSTAQIADYSDQQFTETYRISGVENFSVMNKTGHVKIEYKNLFNQVGKNSATIRTSNFEDGPNEIAYMMGYESRTIYSTQLSSQLKSKKENSVYSITFGHAYTERNAPDLRRIKYSKQRTAPDSMYMASIANIVDPVNGGGRVYQFLMEQTYSMSQNFMQKIPFMDSTFIELNFGSYYETKYRMFKARVLGYTITPGFTAFNLKRLPIGQIFADENTGGQGLFNMDEITSASDKYFAQNLQAAGYGMAKIPMGNFSLVAGARYEYNKQSLQGYVNLDSIHPEVVTKYILPSFNATYNFNRKSLVRGAYGKTLNRPEFREWSPFYFYDFEFRSGTYGSLFPSVIAPEGAILKVARIDNYDLRFEMYPSDLDYIHIGVFYKSFVDPIQQVILNSGGSDSRAFTFTNAKSAFVEGAELDLRKNLSCLDSAWSTSAFGNFNIVMNLSFMKSRLYFDTSVVVNQSTETPLQGQSPYVVNAGVYYQNDSIGFQASLLYNVFGPRLFLVGTLDYANIGELPRNSLDLTVSQNVLPCLAILFSAQNVLDQPVLLTQDTNRNGKFESNKNADVNGDQEIMNYRTGAYYTIGIRFMPDLGKKKKTDAAN